MTRKKRTYATVIALILFLSIIFVSPDLFKSSEKRDGSPELAGKVVGGGGQKDGVVGQESRGGEERHNFRNPKNGGTRQTLKAEYSDEASLLKEIHVTKFYSSDHDTIDIEIHVWDGAKWTRIYNYRGYGMRNSYQKTWATPVYYKWKIKYEDYEHNDNIYYKGYYIAIPLAKAEKITVHGEEGEDQVEDNRVFPGRGPYVVQVDVISAQDLQDLSSVYIGLDYNVTNVTMRFDLGEGTFSKLQDRGDHVELLPSEYYNDGKENWYINFTLKWNFNFPHERQCDVFVKVTSVYGYTVKEWMPAVFRVENDLEFEGEPMMIGEYQGEVEKGDWVRGGERLTLRNMTVRYEDAPGVFPDDDNFDVRITDTKGNEWWDKESGGEEVVIDLYTTGYLTDPDEEYLITVENIPGDGLCVSNLTFPLKIDGHAPLSPVKVTCELYGREVDHVKTPSVNITWDEVKDNGSGLKGYYYSQSDNQGTDNGTFTEETEGEIEELDEGIKEVFVWPVDNVGNIGRSANSSILIDLTEPKFENLFPTDGSWHNHTKIECSVDILDTDGSGVDPESVSYALSADGPYGFGPWIPTWVSEGGERATPEVKCSFEEGTENYIKWRAKDLSGNGFAESSPVNLKIDITSPGFAEEISPEPGWYDQRRIVSTIFLYDDGSGVDHSTLKARVSTTGKNEFGPWMEIRGENITEKDDGFELSFAYTYAEGPDNFLMFKGTDNVANPFSYSRHFNYRIDTAPVYFTDFDPPTDEFSEEKEVECLIDIYDDGIGVEPKSVEYSVSTNGKEDFGAWRRVYDVSVGNPTMVRIELEFDWGMDNYVRFRADDKIGTGVNVSEAYRVWVNSEPEAVISFPPDNREYTVNKDILFDASNSTDVDGDILSFFWTSNVTTDAALGNGTKLKVRLTEGNYTVILHVSDGHGYNVSDAVRVNVAGESDREGAGKGTTGKETSDRGGTDLWIWIIVALAAVLFLIISGILLLIRKRKGTEGKPVAALHSFPSHGTGYTPPSPYYRGQYPHAGSQTYQTRFSGGGYGWAGAQGQGGQARGPGPSGGEGGAARFYGPGSPQPSSSVNSPGSLSATTRVSSPLAPRQQGGTGWGGQQQPALPIQASGTQRSELSGQPPQSSTPQYTLPSFGTDAGPQDLNRLALPPPPASDRPKGAVGGGASPSGKMSGVQQPVAGNPPLTPTPALPPGQKGTGGSSPQGPTSPVVSPSVTPDAREPHPPPPESP